MKFDTLTKMADKCMKYKYIVKNIARRHNKVATFMPKPLFQDNGSGMHTHQSLWKDGTNLSLTPTAMLKSVKPPSITSADCSSTPRH